MNVFLLPKQKFKHLAFVWLLCLFAGSAMGQAIEFLETVKNESVSYTFDNYSSWKEPEIEVQALNGTAIYNPASTNNGLFGIAETYPTSNTVVYTPDPGFIGEDVFVIRYRKQIGTYSSSSADKIIHVTVRPTSIVAVDDYAMMTAGETITVEVLNNDFSDGTDLTIKSVPNINNGSYTLVDGDTKVEFTAEPGFSGVAGFNYSICDAQGECDVATVSICVLDGSSTLDPVTIFTKKNASQVILTPLEGFSLQPGNAVNDRVEFTEDNVWEYTPELDFIGSEFITFVNDDLDEQVIEVVVLNADDPNTFLREDLAFVTVNGEVTIDMLANDIGGTSLSGIGIPGGPVITTANGGTAIYNYSSKDITYIPAEGFEGIDQFSYRAAPPQFSGSYEFEKITVVVSDLNPSQTLFNLKTPENTPLVVAYSIPIEDYVYSNIDDSSLEHGSVAYYPGETTISINGEDVTGFNMLVYTPNENAVAGAIDEFEFDYCVGGDATNCELVKIEVEVINVNSAGDPECAGNKCVWAGDTNTDGVVDVRDILPIGLCMGEVGLERESANTDWYGQYSEDWSLPGIPGFNVKHIDANGDGIIEAVDTDPITEYYGMHHNLTPEVATLNSDNRLYLEDFLPTEPLSAGDVVVLDLNYGNVNNPIIDAHGLTFELAYDLGIFELVNVIYDANSWMSYNSPILTMTHEASAGKLHGGYTRTGGHAASGFGVIGKVEFIVIDDFDGFRFQDSIFQVSINPMGQMNSAGQTTGLSGNTITFALDFDNDDETVENESTTVREDQLKVYPNPAQEQLNIHLNGLGNELEQVIVYSVTGQEMYNSGSIQTKRVELNVGQYAPGSYLVKTFTNGGVFTKKFEVVK